MRAAEFAGRQFGFTFIGHAGDFLACIAIVWCLFDLAGLASLRKSVRDHLTWRTYLDTLAPMVLAGAWLYARWMT